MTGSWSSYRSRLAPWRNVGDVISNPSTVRVQYKVKHARIKLPNIKVAHYTEKIASNRKRLDYEKYHGICDLQSR